MHGRQSSGSAIAEDPVAKTRALNKLALLAGAVKETEVESVAPEKNIPWAKLGIEV